MPNIGELSMDVKVDEGSLRKSTKKVQDTFKKTGDSVENNFTKKTEKGAGRIRSSFSGLGGIIAGVFSITAITQFTKSLFSLGSDLEEVSSKFNVVFNGSEKVRQNFEDLAVATNRSKLDLITFGSDLGDVLKPLGLAQEEVDGLSVGLTKLAIDVASFNNASDAQVINAFRSALTGEREALKSLGIVISEADVKQRAYNLGLQESGAELTKQQKALATYQLLLENTSDAQGDAVRTSESFANQLKGLRGAIKDVFANAGQSVAQETSGILKKLTVFVSSYGEAIITTIAETGKVIATSIGDLLSTFGELFAFVGSGTTETNDNLANTAYFFQKLVQGFGVGVKLISTAIKSLVSIVAVAMNAFIQYWKFAFNSIDEAWGILKGSILGTLKTIIDGVELGVDTIGLLFKGMAEAVVGVFKGLADNTSVAIKKAVNVAIKGINGFIDLANKIPGVDINRIVPLDDVDFKPFTLNIKKNLGEVGKRFKEFGAEAKGNYESVSQNFGKLNNDFKDGLNNVVGVSKEAFSDMGDQWTEFGNYVQEGNDRINKSIKDGAKKAEENTKKYEEGYFNILDILDKYKGSVDESNDKTEEQGEIAKEAVDEIKKQYKDWQDALEEIDKNQEKLKDNIKEYNQEIKESILSIESELLSLNSEYQKTIDSLDLEGQEKLAERYVEVLEKQKEVLNDINEIELEAKESEEERQEDLEKINEQIEVQEQKIREITDKTKESTRLSLQNKLEDLKATREQLKNGELSLEQTKKKIELEKQAQRLAEEQKLIEQETTEAQRQEAQRVAGLNEAELIKETTEAKKQAEKEKFEAERDRLTRLQEINEYFLNLEKLNEESLNAFLNEERYKQLTKEEQDLILKLAKEKIQHTAQKEALIQMQREIANATIALSNGATQIQLNNINNLKEEYASLISSINSAIEAQRRLNSVKSQSRQGFAQGGFTGTGGTNEVAGVVHKGEWVAPKWMVNSMRPIFEGLESKRTKGFAEGGYTSNTNKTQNNNITVNSQVDLRAFIDYAKWKL